MTLFYVVVSAIALLAFGLACWPLWRDRRWPVAAISALAGSAIGFAVYLSTSNFDIAKPNRHPTVAEQLAELRGLANARPDDCPAWRRLGSALLSAGDSAGSVAAFQRAFSICDTNDANLLLDYAEALAENDAGAIAGEAGHLIENALKLDANNLRALWYGGTVAAARGNNELAAERFESMLRPDTPPQVREILTTNIRMLRGEAAPAPAPAAADGRSIDVNVQIADSLGALPAGATFFLIATTEAGGPPLGVVRLPVSQIPGKVTIGDTNAMIPGRNISSQEQVRLIARVSKTGQPQAQPGDLFGQLDIDVASAELVSITIDQVVR